MSLAAVAVRNQRRRAAQQQQGLGDEALTQKSSLDASDPNLKLRKVCVTKTFFIKKAIIRVLIVSQPSHRVLKVQSQFIDFKTKYS